MAETCSRGAFLLETAAVGQAVSVAISYFSTTSVHLRDLALKISLSTTLLIEAANQVNANPFFTPAFQTQFEPVILKHRKNLNTILAAVEKATSYKYSEELEGGPTQAPKRPWKKFLWALDMDEDLFENFEETLGDSLIGVRMVQIVVQLVVIQVNANSRELLPSELTVLTKLKRVMGELIQMLRTCDVASVVAFSLSEPEAAANATQIARESVKELLYNNDDASSVTASVSSYVPSLKIEDIRNGVRKDCTQEAPVIILPATQPEHFEMYRISISTNLRSSKQTTFSILKIPFTISKKETHPIIHFDQVPASQEEISVFMGATNDCILIRNTEVPRVSAPVIDDCTALPTIICHQIYSHLNEKNRKEYMYVWSIGRVVQMEPVPSSASKPRLWRKEKTGKPANEKFVVILRRSYKPGHGAPPPPPPPLSGWRPPKHLSGPPPPPPPGWPSGGPVPIINRTGRQRVGRDRSRRFRSRSRSSTNSSISGNRKYSTKIELTQSESEKVINDFLATFSTIYEGVAVDERGKAMREIILDEEESEYDSDSSGSSRSLVDD